MMSNSVVWPQMRGKIAGAGGNAQIHIERIKSPAAEGVEDSRGENTPHAAAFDNQRFLAFLRFSIVVLVTRLVSGHWCILIYLDFSLSGLMPSLLQRLFNCADDIGFDIKIETRIPTEFLIFLISAISGAGMLTRNNTFLIFPSALFL